MKSWIKKHLFKEKRKPEETGVDAPALNWFIHVLIENVGYNKWVKMTRAEQEKYDRDCPYNAGYPYKVVTSPIPEGKDIVLKDSGTYTIRCDSEHTRNLIIEMARSYDELERKYHYSLRENSSETWHAASELKSIPFYSSFRGPRTFLVTSPELCFVGGIALGMENEGKWYVLHGEQKVEHKVTHYRHLPPHPFLHIPDYEEIKTEVERLRTLFKNESI